MVYADCKSDATAKSAIGQVAAAGLHGELDGDFDASRSLLSYVYIR